MSRKKIIALLVGLILLFGIGGIILWQRDANQVVHFERYPVDTEYIMAGGVGISDVQLEELRDLGLYEPSEVLEIQNVLITPKDIEFFVHLMYMRYDDAFAVMPDSLSLGMEIIMADFASRLFNNNIDGPNGFVDFNNAILRAEHEMEGSGFLHSIGIRVGSDLNRDAFLTMLQNGHSTKAQMYAHYLGTLELSESEQLRLATEMGQQRILTGLWASQSMMIATWCYHSSRNIIRDVSINNFDITSGVATLCMNYSVHSRGLLSGAVTITPGETHSLNIRYTTNENLEGLFRLKALRGSRGDFIISILDEFQHDRQHFISQLTTNIIMGGNLSDLGLVVLPNADVEGADALYITKQTLNVINDWNKLIVGMNEGAVIAFRSFFVTGVRLNVTETDSESLAVTVGLFEPNVFMLINALEPNGGGLRGILLEGNNGESPRHITIEERFNMVIFSSDDPEIREQPLAYQLINGDFSLIVDDGSGNTIFNTEEFRLALDELSTALGTHEDGFSIWDEIIRHGGLRDSN
jgi:hypothetical protein